MLLRYSELGETPRDIDADVCIVGGGAAGLTLAASLARRGRQVVLLEAGGISETDASQRFYEGEVANPAVHWPLHFFRVRALGGTSRLWGGRVVPYDPIDFATRPWVPHSGWPIGPETLAPYYPAALAAAEGGRFDYTPSGPIVPGLESERLHTTVERFSRPTDFWARYGAMLTASDVRVVTDAAVTAVRLTADGCHVDHLEVRGGDTLRRVRAESYVLAVGGLETTRLLLASNDILPAGIGNAGGWVGRGYMCHLAATFGEVRFTGPPRDIGFDYERDTEGVYLRRRISLTEAAQRELEVMNFTARLHIFDASDPGHRNGVLSLIFLAAFAVKYEYSRAMREADRSWRVMLRHVGNIAREPFRLFHFARTWGLQRYLGSRRIPSIALYSRRGHYPLEFHSEQAPNFASRVTLGDDRDAYGMPRLKVDWQLTPLDFMTVRKAYRLIASELRRSGTGELTFDDAGVEAAVLKAGAYGGHHTGTARMSASPEEGVVDGDCRVHGVDNLHLAGGAVLPTSSQANPTLTILALTLRLADHLARERLSATIPQRVLVTGAAGFVGRTMVQRLAKAGFLVRAGTRTGAAGPDGTEACVCDVLDPASVTAAVAGVQAVVHCAVDAQGGTRVIVEGMRNVLAAARAQGGVHVIQLSSVAVYGALPGLIDEMAPTNAPQGAYGAAKLAAEVLCREAADAGVPVTVLRPSSIWGRESRQWTTLYVERMRSGLWHALGKLGEGKANLVHVEDLAGFVVHLLHRPEPRAEAVYNVNGTQALTWNDYFNGLRTALALPLPLPERRFGGVALVLRQMVRVADKLVVGRMPSGSVPRAWQRLRDYAAAIPSRDEMSRFAGQQSFDIARMRATGYEPGVDLGQGVADIARGFIPKFDEPDSSHFG